MECLDLISASLKGESKDTSKMTDERATTSAALAERETTYMEIVLLYADLHE